MCGLFLRQGLHTQSFGTKVFLHCACKCVDLECLVGRIKVTCVSGRWSGDIEGWNEARIDERVDDVRSRTEVVASLGGVFVLVL